jgi:hypothetical protein
MTESQGSLAGHRPAGVPGETSYEAAFGATDPYDVLRVSPGTSYEVTVGATASYDVADRGRSPVEPRAT